MTIFSNQTQNTILAAPDGANGQPSFRGLTANDLPSQLHVVVMTADTANIQYTDTYWSPQYKISANTLAVGSTFKLTVAADALYNYQPALNLRFGTTGTTTDPTLFEHPYFLGTGIFEYIVTFRSVGASANVQVVPLTRIPNPGGGLTDIVGKAYATVYTTVDTTVNNYMGFSHHMGYPGVGTNIFNTCIIQQIK